MEWQSKTGCKTGIYKILNTVTGCVYIGQASSSTLEERTRSHRQALRWGNHGIGSLQQDWNKYGEKAFLFSIEMFIENKNDDFQDVLDEEETRIMLSYPLRYNTRIGGSGRHNYDEAARKRLSVAAQNKNMTTEQRELRNQRHRITVKDPETQERIGKQTKKRWEDPAQREHLLSVTQTPEINEIRSAASREYWSDPAVRQAQTEKNYQMHSDPEFKERHRASVKAAHAGEEGFLKYSTAMAKGWVKRHANMAKPEYQAKEAERCRKIRETKARKKAEKLRLLSSSHLDNAQSQE